MDETQQREICDRYGADFSPPLAGSRVGIALQTLGEQPLNGLRIGSNAEVCGWYIWAGTELSTGDDFYQPMCVEHLADKCPSALPFLALPPGWRFLMDGDYVDVWYDAALVAGRAKT